jgi:hypothetical protein
MHTSLRLAALGSALAFTATAHAGTLQTIDFNDLTHGQIIDDEYAAQGLTISARNTGGGPDLAVAFDSDITGSTRDSDLQFFGQWAGGNAKDTAMGRMLIIQENNWGNDGSFVSHPDDEGSRPAGQVTFAFDRAVEQIGFDLIDFQDGERVGSSIVSIFDGNQQVSIDFSLFDDAGQFNVAGFEAGDRYANTVPMIDLAALGLTNGATKVVFSFGGSMAIDNFRYVSAVPTPTAAGAGMLGLLGLGWRRRRAA